MLSITNIVVLALITGVILIGRFVRGNPIWRDATLSLWKRRRIAIVVIGLFVTVGVLDSIRWADGSAGNDTIQTLASFEQRSVLDRLFGEDLMREKSYSAPFASTEFYGDNALTYPGMHAFGTDVLGRDIFHLTLKGIRVALMIGGLTSLIAIPLALFFGVAAGYFGKRIDDAVFFLMSTFASIPDLLLLIALIMAMGRGTLQVCIALGITGWVGFCRISRAETMKLREANYVQAARALGVSDARIIWNHILPNLAHMVIITFALLFTSLVLAETILAYLGVGVDGSWGQMIDQARDEFSRDPVIWWNFASASSALFILVLTINLIGDALRDVLDPRTLRETE